MTHRLLVALSMTLLAVAPAAAATVEVPLDPAVIAKLPPIAAGKTAHGQELVCTGVSLAALLRANGVMPDTPLRGAQQLSRAVVVSARDGYSAVFSLGELDASLGANEVVLTRHCNGADLGAEDGPWRLVAPKESRPARWVRQVETIRVVDLP